MINTSHSLLLIAVMSAITAAIRFMPFVIFRSDEKLPKSVKYLGSVLPGAVMGMLAVYCFKSVSVFTPPHAAPELIAASVVAGTYLWRRNTLISIGAGTVLYMVLVQTVFS